MNKKESNDFEKLLSYFESEKPKSKHEKLKNGPKNLQKIEKKKELSKTKQLLDASQIDEFSDIYYSKQEPGIKGFDVNKFETLMRAKLIDERKRLQSYDRPYISVSELYTCLRSCYYNRKKFEIPSKNQFYFSYLYMIQKIGNSIHDIIQEMYDFDEIEKSVLSEKYKVKGRVDAIKDDCIGEIKTIADKKFKNTYIKEHFLQANIYAYILNSEYDYKIKNVTLIYVPRSLTKIYPFSLKVDNDSAKEYLSRALILQECLKLNKIPKTIGSNKEQCYYCSYKEICKKEIDYKQEITKKPNKETVFLL